MKFLYLVLISLFFSSCISSSNDSETSSDLFYEQWSINYDANFYEKNNITLNSHINVQNVLNEYTGKGIKIAVIDNGFDINHPEIKDKIISTIYVDSFGTTISSDISHSKSSEFHGTAVAGIIGASDDNYGIRGIAPDSELILIKYSESSSDAGTIRLFDEAIKAGADVINCSWGTNSVSEGVRSYLEDISKTARDGKGISIVFASGNSDISISNDESSVRGIIAVGASGEDNLRTSYSNYGEELNLLAPGGEFYGISTIDVPGINGTNDNDYIKFNGSSTFTGTSASAPIVSGAIALALQKNINLTNQEIIDILKYSTNTIGNNTPYVDEMISSNELQPTITGLLGALSNSNIVVQLTNNSTNVKTSTYDIVVNIDNTFSSKIQEDLSEGIYTIRLLNSKLNSQVLATHTNFIINYSNTSITNKNVRKSDYYGYGKLDLNKFINNISSL